MKVLTQFIDIDNIPHFYGGNCRKDLKENPGPWDEELIRSKVENYIHTKNRELYDNVYLTEDEKSKIDKKNERIEKTRETSPYKPPSLMEIPEEYKSHK